jgi:hypothetical protein
MANEWLRYANRGATRNLPISPQLANAFSFLPQMGLSMEVFSGGQPAKGSGGARVGSVRHDHGNAADVFFHQGGRRLDWANPNDRPIFEDIVRRGKAAGVTGFGAGPGYMQQGSMHVGFGSPGVWGEGGRGANAPAWLTAAYNGATAPAMKAGSAGSLGGVPARSVETTTVAPTLQDMYANAQAATFTPPTVGDAMAGFLQTRAVQQQAQAERDAADMERRRALFSDLASMYA